MGNLQVQLQYEQTEVREKLEMIDKVHEAIREAEKVGGKIMLS